MAIRPQALFGSSGPKISITQPARQSAMMKLAQQMAAKPTPVYNVGDAVAAFGKPFAAGLLERRQEKQKKEEQQSYMDSLQAALERAKRDLSTGPGEAGGGTTGLAEAFMTSGNPQLAQEGAKMAAQLEIRRAMRPEAKTPETFEVMTPQEAQAAGFQPGSVVQRSSTGKTRVVQEPPEAVEPEKPMSAAGKLARDRERGLIDEKTYRTQLAALGGPDTEVTIDQKQQDAESAEFGKSLVRQYDAVAQRASDAQDEIALLEMALAIPVESGRLAPTRAAIAALAQDIGVDPATLGLDRAENAEAYRGILNNLVLTKMQAQKGPQTENDARRIEQTLASLEKTPEANEFLIRSSIALNRRRVEQLNFYDAYRQRTGTLDGARGAWDRFKNNTPLLGTNPNTGMPVFYGEFRDAIRAANPQATEDSILELWRLKYGNPGQVADNGQRPDRSL